MAKRQLQVSGQAGRDEGLGSLFTYQTGMSELGT